MTEIYSTLPVKTNHSNPNGLISRHSFGRDRSNKGLKRTRNWNAASPRCCAELGRLQQRDLKMFRGSRWAAVWFRTFHTSSSIKFRKSILSVGNARMQLNAPTKDASLPNRSNIPRNRGYPFNAPGFRQTVRLQIPSLDACDHTRVRSWQATETLRTEIKRLEDALTTDRFERLSRCTGKIFFQAGQLQIQLPWITPCLQLQKTCARRAHSQPPAPLHGTSGTTYILENDLSSAHCHPIRKVSVSGARVKPVVKAFMQNSITLIRYRRANDSWLSPVHAPFNAHKARKANRPLRVMGDGWWAAGDKSKAPSRERQIYSRPQHLLVTGMNLLARFVYMDLGNWIALLEAISDEQLPQFESLLR